MVSQVANHCDSKVEILEEFVNVEESDDQEDDSLLVDFWHEQFADLAGAELGESVDDFVDC